MPNPGNDPFPKRNQVTKLGQWAMYTGGIGNPDTGTYTLAIDSLWDVTFPQITVMKLQPCVITKIHIQSNGSAEWTSGTQNYFLWKNNTARVAPADFNSGALQITDMDQVDGQAQKWFDVNIPVYSQDDVFTASLITNALTGGPEGQTMTLWGIAEEPAAPPSPLTADPIVGTNANGTFWKYADGRLICYDEDSTNRTTNLSVGSVYRSSAWVTNFAHPFVSTPVLVAGAQYVSGTSLLGAGQAGPTTTLGTTLRINGSVNSSVGRIVYHAIGNWK
jgi:hypothetical protein